MAAIALSRHTSTFEGKDSGQVAAKANDLALAVRRHCLHMTHSAKSSHIGSCLSAADLLAVLYGGILNVRYDEPEWPDRDRFVMSKGHAAAALYAVLAESRFFEASLLDDFYSDGTQLPGHVTHVGIPGVEVSTGSLGHGLPIALGLALGLKQRGTTSTVFAMLSDGELDEGSNWEAILMAPQFRLDNLIAIIDYNKIQSLGRVEEVAQLAPLADKFRAFRWNVREVDGHDIRGLVEVFMNSSGSSDRPTCVIAHTVKGKGVSEMEDKLLWHYRWPRSQDVATALSELGR